MCSSSHNWYAGSIYRIAEFSQGYNGYLISHEIFVYIFEAGPMVPPLCLFNIWHPAKTDKCVEQTGMESECAADIELNHLCGADQTIS
jgi:hypothetical protein